MRSPIKIHGGKSYLHPLLIYHFPHDFVELDYIEPYVGGASVLLNKPVSITETINDIDSGLMAMWHILKYDYDNFLDQLEFWPYEKESFLKAKILVPTNKLEQALKEFVLRRMSRGGTKETFGWQKRLRGNQPGDRNAWETIKPILLPIHQRLQSVDLLNMDALDLVRGGKGFIYLDPPYVKETRQASSRHIYEYEMSNRDHEILLSSCLESEAKILISGYPSEIYQRKLKHWNYRDFEIANHSSQESTKQTKIERIWYNYEEISCFCCT